MIAGDQQIGNETGRLGEEIACKYLENKGFDLICRNYRRKWGEIDIVTRDTKGKLRFVEVKSVSRDLSADKQGSGVTQETYRPEDNVHHWKLQKMARIIQTYLSEKRLEDEEWQFDVISVMLDVKRKEAKVETIEDVVIEC